MQINLEKYHSKTSFLWLEKSIGYLLSGLTATSPFVPSESMSKHDRSSLGIFLHLLVTMPSIRTLLRNGFLLCFSSLLNLLYGLDDLAAKPREGRCRMVFGNRVGLIRRVLTRILQVYLLFLLENSCQSF